MGEGGKLTKRTVPEWCRASASCFLVSHGQVASQETREGRLKGDHERFSVLALARERYMKTLSHPVTGPRGAAAVLLTLFLALFFTAPAYACHSGQPHGRDKTPCLNPLEGVESLNEAQFNDNYIAMDPQLFRRQATATLESGDYVAEELGWVEVATDDLSRAADSQRNAGMCGIMDTASGLDPSARGPFLSTPDEFSYGWTDNCTDGGCNVEVSMAFSGQDVIDLTEGRSDQLVIVMRASVANPGQNIEPFLVPTKISIGSMLATYNKIGTSRPLVNCQFAPQGWGGPVLRTNPVQP
jgi:hypothetical protein